MQVKLVVDETATGWRSAAEWMGGEYVMGISVNPNGRAGVSGGKTAFMKGGPIGSTAMIALTNCGLASANDHPYCPD